MTLGNFLQHFTLFHLKLYGSLRQGSIDKLIVAKIIDEPVQTGLEARQISDGLETVSKDLSLAVIQLLHSGEELRNKFSEENWKIC